MIRKHLCKGKEHFSWSKISSLPSRWTYCKTTGHRETTHLAKLITYPMTVSPPTTNHQLTDRPSTNPPTTNLLVTHSPTWLTINHLTHQIYFNRVTTEPFLSLISICHSHWILFITEFIKSFIKWLVKKNVDKLQILLIIPFENSHLKIRIYNKNIWGEYRFSKCLLF